MHRIQVIYYINNILKSSQNVLKCSLQDIQNTVKKGPEWHKITHPVHGS